MRCAACDHSWFARPPETLNTDDSKVEDESGLTRAQVERLRQKAEQNNATRSGPHAEIREKTNQRQRRNRTIAASTAWALTGALLVGGATASITQRQQIVEMWPKTASFYAMAGMEVNRFGLEFDGIEARRSFDGTTPVLTIAGQVVNVSERHRPSPVVRLGLRDEDGVEVHVERVSLIETVVAPGEAGHFTAHIVAPPLDSFDLEASFEAAEEFDDDTESYHVGASGRYHVEDDRHADAEGAGHDNEHDGHDEHASEEEHAGGTHH